MPKNKRRNSNKNKNNAPKTNRYASTSKNGRDQIKEDAETKIEKSRLKKEANIQRIDNCVSVINHLCLAGFTFFIEAVICLVLVTLVILFICLIVAYLRGSKDSDSIAKIITVIQLVSGIISLVIGIWGVVLSYQANKNIPSSKTPITTTTVPSAVKAKGTNDQVNMGSIE